MNRTRAMLRRHTRWATVLPGVLLLIGLVIAGVHHHATGDTHPCAVCTAGHVAATPTVAQSAPAAPSEWCERLALAPETIPSASPARTHRGRAPPLG